MKLSHLSGRVGLSPTIAIDEKVRELTAQGKNILSFGAGQPDAGTPPHVGEAGAQAIRDGKTRYTSPGGTLELREAIVKKLDRENGLDYKPGEILVSAGAKQAIYMALAVLIDPGDDVLIPAPYWVSYPAQVAMLGGTPRVIETDEATGFKLTPDALQAAIGPKSCCLILNSPSNPTGAVYSPEELESLLAVVRDSGLYLITDEIYEHILYDGAVHKSAVAVCPEIRERTAIVNGVSKSFSMTGWRIGYFAAPAEWVGKAAALQSQLCGSPCSISQEAARAAMEGTLEFPHGMVEAFTRRRGRLLEILGDAPDLKLCPPEGAFYAFPDVSAYFGRAFSGGRIEDPTDLAAYLIEEASIALVPGAGFGSTRNLRISFAVSDEAIETGMGAMIEALAKLS